MTAGTVGAMQMPPNFKYREVFLKGRPEHARDDSFLFRHPPMPAAKWAKIFSPFDALRGFGGALAAKDILYVPRMEPDEDAKRDLGRKLELLRSLTPNNRMARKNRVAVTLNIFVPCPDENSAAFGCGNMGQYKSVTGIVLKVDPEVTATITLQCEGRKRTIDFQDIIQIERAKENEAG